MAKVSPYKLQMDALLRSQSDYDRAAGRRDEQQTQGQILGQLGQIINTAGTPVATAAEIMAKQTPRAVPMGQGLITAGQNIAQGGVDQYKDVLNRYNMQNKIAETLSKMKTLEKDDELRDLKMESLRQDIAEKKKPFAQSREGQKFKMGMDYKTQLSKKQPTVGSKQRDKDFTKEWTKFNDLGGFSVIESNLSKLKRARQGLQKALNERVKGGWNIGVSGAVVGSTPEKLLPIFNPEATQVQEAIAEVAQGNLRQVLGGQFAQKEGEQLIRRAFNPSLPEEMNIERLDRLISQIEKAAGAKVAAGRYYEDNNNSLMGYKGPAYYAKFDIGTFYDGLDKETPMARPSLMNEAVADEPERIETFQGVKYRFLGGDDTKKENWEKIGG